MLRPRRKLRCCVWRGVLLVIRYTTCFGIVMWAEYTHTHTHFTKSLAKPISQHDASASLWTIKRLSFLKQNWLFNPYKTTTFVASEREPKDYTMKGFYGQYQLIQPVFFSLFLEAFKMTKVIVESLWTCVSSQSFVGKNVFLRFMQPNIQLYKTSKSKNPGNFDVHIVSALIFPSKYLTLDAFTSSVVFLYHKN